MSNKLISIFIGEEKMYFTSDALRDYISLHSSDFGDFLHNRFENAEFGKFCEREIESEVEL